MLFQVDDTVAITLLKSPDEEKEYRITGVNLPEITLIDDVSAKTSILTRTRIGIRWMLENEEDDICKITFKYKRPPPTFDGYIILTRGETGKIQQMEIPDSCIYTVQERALDAGIYHIYNQLHDKFLEEEHEETYDIKMFVKEAREQLKENGCLDSDKFGVFIKIIKLKIVDQDTEYRRKYIPAGSFE